MTTTNQTKLTGDSLLEAVTTYETKGLTKSELVIACGYHKDGVPSFVPFYEQLLVAKGVEMTLPKVSDGEDVSYTIQIPVQSYVVVTIDGKGGMTREEICDAVTRTDLGNSEGEITWDDVKDAWREGDIEGYIIEDENGNEID